MRSSLAVALPLALLLLAAAPLLTSARYNGELLRPFGINAQSNQDALLSFSAVSVPTFSPRLSLTAANSECCDCVHTVAHHIIDSTLKAVADACSNVTCPVIKQRCDWIEAHQAEYTGVIAVELRPITDGFMYCYGNGTCDHPGVPKSDISSSLFMLDSASNPQLLSSQIAAAAPFVERAMETRVDWSAAKESKEDDSRVANLARRIGSEEVKRNERSIRRRMARLAGASDESESAVATADEHHKKRDCHSCLRHGVRWVLKHSIRHLKAACKETKCPHFQRFCAWAKEHKETVRGMVYATVQPYKAAGGYCAGNGSCHHDKHHGEDKASMGNAPFTMGDKDESDKRDESTQTPPVIGGGEHDRVPHGPAADFINSIINKLRN